MSRTHIIGLAGPAGCGKDTTADLLVTHCGFVKLAFSDPLYTEVSDAFGIEIAQLKQRDTKEHGMAALALRKCRADGFVGRMLIQHQLLGHAIDLWFANSARPLNQCLAEAFEELDLLVAPAGGP